jgi:hypothetical protein
MIGSIDQVVWMANAQQVLVLLSYRSEGGWFDDMEQHEAFEKLGS